jgi:hypothetical protein
MATVPNAAPDIDPPTTASNRSSTTPAMMSHDSPQHHGAHATLTPTGDQHQQPTLSQASQPSSSTPNQHQQQSRSVKRPRPVKSCTECRKRKLKCDRSCPCAQCVKSHRLCKYATDQEAALSDGSEGEMTETGRPPKKLRFSASGAGSGSPGAGNSSINGAATQTAPPTLEPTLTPVRNGEPPAAVTLEDVLARVERLEHVMKARPPAKAEAAMAKPQRIGLPGNTIRQLSVKKNALRTRFFGQNSTRVLIDLVRNLRPGQPNGGPSNMKLNSFPRHKTT